MKKIILSIITIFLIFIGFSYWDNNDYLEYADIPWTDTITMNWNIDGNTYRVFVNTWTIDYVTWSDGKLHDCFPLQWTWYTKKLWEIYFNYEWYSSYVCDDNKLRWVFKIWAGWRWHMEDLNNNPEKWKLFLDKTKTNWNYYHNWDNNWWWTGQARLDNIWYSNWGTVRTKFDNQQAWSKINVISIINWSNIIANWVNKANIKICLFYNGSWLVNYTVDSIKFISWYDSDVVFNWEDIPWFSYTWDLTTNNNGCLTWYVTSLHGWTALHFWIKIKKWNNIYKTEWTTSAFTYPFGISATLTWKDIPWKILMWWTNSISFTWEKDSKIDSLKFKNIKAQIDLGNYNKYFDIITWTNINIDWKKYDLKIDRNSNFYSGDYVNISYNISWTYIITTNWKTYTIPTFQKNNILAWKIYKDWKINKFYITKETDSASAIADWKSILWYKIKFLNSDWKAINNLSFSWQVIDSNKYFNLNKDNNSYITWIFLTKDNSQANIYWVYRIWLISYKPVSNINLTWLIYNIQYHGHYNFINNDKYVNSKNINFTNIANLSFENKTLKVNENNTINVSYDWDNISNPSFDTTWYEINWSGCSFIKWKNINWNSTWDSSHDIKVNCSIEAPSAIIYTWYYKYDLNWEFWEKTVYNFYKKIYSPVLFIWWAQIKVLWNVVSNKNIIWWITYISTAISPNVFKEQIKKKIYKNYIMWWKLSVIPPGNNIDLSSLTWSKIYKCNSNEILNIWWNNKQPLSLYFIWCWINIKSNIRWNWKLNIFWFRKRWDIWYNFSSLNGWEKWWNIYINNNVKSIKANIITDGSIFTYIWSNPTSESIFTWRINNDNLKSQLFIRWKIFSRNTIWWGNKDINNNYMFVWWRKINANATIFWKPSTLVSKAYDITFLKNNFVDDSWDYDTWVLSQYIYNKYHCTWHKDQDKSKLCYSSIVIEDWN